MVIVYVIVGVVILGSLVAVSILGDRLARKVLKFIKEEERC